jgi:FkbM family methyltransferase
MGRVALAAGAIEVAELRAAIVHAYSGSTVFDVGANVGLFTIALSQAVGPSGRVMAMEPIASTAVALRANIERNRLSNVTVIEAAAVEQDGNVEMHLSDDPALHSLGTPIEGHLIVGTAIVPGRSLDSVWFDIGRPQVSLLKIDAEGAECRVVAGAIALIEMCQPIILVEANGPAQLTDFVGALPIAYRECSMQIEPWNHLLVPASHAG